MYEFGAQLGHENAFLFYVEDFTGEFGNLGNELEDKLVSKDIYRKIYKNISSVILQPFRECARDQRARNGGGNYADATSARFPYLSYSQSSLIPTLTIRAFSLNEWSLVELRWHFHKKNSDSCIGPRKGGYLYARLTTTRLTTKVKGDVGRRIVTERHFERVT